MTHRKKTVARVPSCPIGCSSPRIPTRVIEFKAALWLSLIQDLHFSPGPSSPSLLLSRAQSGLSVLHLHFLRDTWCCAKLLRSQIDKETFSLRPPAPTPLGLCVRDST